MKGMCHWHLVILNTNVDSCTFCFNLLVEALEIGFVKEKH